MMDRIMANGRAFCSGAFCPGIERDRELPAIFQGQNDLPNGHGWAEIISTCQFLR